MKLYLFSKHSVNIFLSYNPQEIIAINIIRKTVYLKNNVHHSTYFKHTDTNTHVRDVCRIG